MPSVFVTRAIPEPGLHLLHDAGYAVDIYEKDEIIPRAELLKRVKGKDAILSLLTDKIDEDVFKTAGPQLKIVGNYAVGFDNIDLAAARARNVIVTNTPVPEMSDAVAEFTIALMFDVARRVSEGDRFARAGLYEGWSPTLFLGNNLKGKTLGIIGVGRIGARVAEIARLGLGMKIVYQDTKPNPEFSEKMHAPLLPLDQLLQVSDVISLHVPLFPSTKHLISTDAFALMKPGAILLNTARGPIVDEKALLRALKTNRIAGAGIDVYEAEPAIDTDPTDHLELKAMPNVVMTPHMASATVDARAAMSRLAAANILAVLSGEPALTPAK